MRLRTPSRILLYTTTQQRAPTLSRCEAAYTYFGMAEASSADPRIEALHDMRRCVFALVASFRRACQLYPAKDRDTVVYMLEAFLIRAIFGKDSEGILADCEFRRRMGGYVIPNLFAKCVARIPRPTLWDGKLADTVRKFWGGARVRYSEKDEGETKYVRREKAKG